MDFCEEALEEIQNTPDHGDVGDVCHSNLVDPGDLESFMQVGVGPVLRARLAGVGTPINVLKPDEAHQTPYPPAIDVVPLASQPHAHTSGAIKASSDNRGPS